MSVDVRAKLAEKGITLPVATKQILDTWGSDGWELVTVIPAPGGEQLVAYMKREVK